MGGFLLVKKYQIFISSTFNDLKDVRTKVKDAILMIGHYPAGMEMFGARTVEQWRVIEEEINKSDYYIVILGKCFGTQVPEETISYTQKEFRYAISKGIPILGFIASQDAEIEMDTDSVKIEKLKAFKKEVETGRTVAYWSNAYELATKVVCSLVKEIYGTPKDDKLIVDYTEGVILRDGWNFHNDIALRLEGIARRIYGDLDRPYTKKYDADGIESGGYFAEVMLDLLRVKTEREDNREDISEFIQTLAPYVQKTGYEIPHIESQGLLNKFLELMNI